MQSIDSNFCDTGCGGEAVYIGVVGLDLEGHL